MSIETAQMRRMLDEARLTLEQIAKRTDCKWAAQTAASTIEKIDGTINEPVELPAALGFGDSLSAMETKELLTKCLQLLSRIDEQLRENRTVRAKKENVKEKPAPTYAPPRPVLNPLLPDDLISLSQAAKLLPPRHGKRVHVATIYRWCKQGRLTAFECNGLRVSLTELKSRFKARMAFPKTP